MKLIRVPWNFSPCVGKYDPRWGRTYECYSSNPDIVTKLAHAYVKGQEIMGLLQLLSIMWQMEERYLEPVRGIIL